MVCCIGTHLFHFAEHVNALCGWGRSLRNAVGPGTWNRNPTSWLT
jgi:ribosomal protein L37E